MINKHSGKKTFLTDPNNLSVEVPAYPAPWTLQGRGCILLYKFNRDYFKNKGFITKDQPFTPAGGIGAIMIADYLTSDAGPYAELLFIPGKIAFGGKKWHRITKIYVSTLESVLNGRNNWSIPKEHASFHFSKSSNIIQICVSKNGTTFFEAQLKSWGPEFPVNTKVLPFSLLQGEHGEYLNTKFTGSGVGRLARVSDLKVDQRYFPDPEDGRLLAAIYIDPFNVVFPEAKKIID